MREVWSAPDATTVRCVLEALNARDPRQRAYTTVMTVMTRLVEKGMLGRERSGRVDRYRARMTREEWEEGRAALGVAELVESYGDRALVHFARRLERLDPERREALRRLAGQDE